ncbi:MAG: gluconate 2-dehydrogenase subunit 3 family protein [Sphingomicrobium sp.]|nr:gluconate 2-dehydrogenase subunit 3 family protein [Sphingomonadales bacterium]
MSHPPSVTYASGAIVRLIGSDLMTEPTTAALLRRLAPVSDGAHSTILDERQLALLAAVAARLVPQTERTAAIDLVGSFHRRLVEGTGVGWRYAELPAAAVMHRTGLAALNASAAAAFGSEFVELQAAQQDELLRTVQSGKTWPVAWRGIDPAMWFEELLATLVDIFYAHPLAQDDIGFAGMADAHGWPDVGLGAREVYEPEPVPGEQLGA